MLDSSDEEGAHTTGYSPVRIQTPSNTKTVSAQTTNSLLELVQELVADCSLTVVDM